MNAIIMAGGKGTRIASLRSDIPKPMIPVCGKPVLEWQIENLRANGIVDITLVIGHMGETIRDYFDNGSKWNVNIVYFVEKYPLGTAGALFKMKLTEDFLLMCGDVMIDIDFNRLIKFHQEHKAWATLVTHPNGHPYDSSLIETEILPPQTYGGLPVETNRVTKWLNKEDNRFFYKNKVNAGIEVISPELINATMLHLRSRHLESLDKIDLDRDVLKPNIASGRVYAYNTPEYIKDMGTPDRFRETEQDILTGRVHARNLKNAQRAIFLDRDGTINIETGWLHNAEDFKLIKGAAEAIRRINNSGYLVIVVSNQPVIARGECTFKELQRIHDKMEAELGKLGAFIDGIYYCPHHPDKGFAGELAEYKTNCDCRKPKPGLFLKAARDWNIDLSQSCMIGDSHRDVEAGNNAGCKTNIKISTNTPNALLKSVIDFFS